MHNCCCFTCHSKYVHNKNSTTDIRSSANISTQTLETTPYLEKGFPVKILNLNSKVNQNIYALISNIDTDNQSEIVTAGNTKSLYALD